MIRKLSRKLRDFLHAAIADAQSSEFVPTLRDYPMRATRQPSRR